MPTVIPVKFAFVPHDLWFDPAESGAAEGDHVICSTERGTEIGLATADAADMPHERLVSVTGGSQLSKVLRVATEEDLAKADGLAARGDDAMPAFRELVDKSGLDIKPVGVEYLFGGEKVVCYFSAEERVDFRQLVRDLSRELHEHVDMRQIGVREQAALIGGYAHCGQELCCARFGREFEPVSIRMAKEQDLPLNSTKISGACGRLMCCLRYEFEAYRDFKGRAPKKNAVIETPLGKAKIIEYDTPKEQLCLRLENGKQVRVPLSGMIASDAAKKKSEDLGCPCRPDTVTREALEALQSPDVQMALADVDRANGIIPEQTFDAADIFVEKPKRQRRSHGSQGGSQGKPAGGSNGSPAGERQGSRRRRRPGGAAAGEQASQASPEAAAGQTRRRRHHSSGEAEAAQQGQPAQAASQAGSQEPGERRTRRRTRKPGDKGGAAAAPRQKGAEPQRKAPSKPAGDGEAPAAPRKRRHRGGRGRGKGQGTGQGTGQGQPDSPSSGE
jgi:cell fate regulator YaaT (PSP1 superfamily)